MLLKPLLDEVLPCKQEKSVRFRTGAPSFKDNWPQDVHGRIPVCLTGRVGSLPTEVANFNSSIAQLVVSVGLLIRRSLVRTQVEEPNNAGMVFNGLAR